MCRAAESATPRPKPTALWTITEPMVNAAPPNKAANLLVVRPMLVIKAVKERMITKFLRFLTV